MARLKEGSLELLSEGEKRLPFYPDQLEAMDENFDRLMFISDNLPDGQIEGGIISFGVADGSANYLVVKENPLTLQHIDYLDGYRVHPALIRGLTKDDVRGMLRRQKRLNDLFRDK